MLGYYNPSVILTLLSAVSAVFGIAHAMSGEEKGVFAAIFCLMISGVCDMFDGAVAAKVKRNEEEKLYGIQLDSLCDLAAFGVLPGVITLSLAENNSFSRIAATLLVLSSVIRLGYFNVQETLRDRKEKLVFYTGLPVTGIAILFPLSMLLGNYLSFDMHFFAPGCLCVFACLEVSRLKLKKPYGLGKWLLLIAGALIFVGMILKKRILG